MMSEEYRLNLNLSELQMIRSALAHQWNNHTWDMSELCLDVCERLMHRLTTLEPTYRASEKG